MEVATLVGAWIEINVALYLAMPLSVAPLVGAWIEIMHHILKSTLTRSLLL